MTVCCAEGHWEAGSALGPSLFALSFRSFPVEKTQQATLPGSQGREGEVKTGNPAHQAPRTSPATHSSSRQKALDASSGPP